MARNKRSWPKPLERRIIVNKLCSCSDEPNPMKLILDGLELLFNSRQLQCYENRMDKDPFSKHNTELLLKECEVIQRLRSEFAEELGYNED
jgi:hypothetical protein